RSPSTSRFTLMVPRFALGFVLCVAGLASCSAGRVGVTGSQTSSSGAGGSGGQATTTASTSGSTGGGATGGGATGGATGGGATADGGPDASVPDDGTPTRVPCTGNFGALLSAIHGRMDGYLVSIVAPGGSHACNGDASHVHLQVQVHGATYD